MPLVPSVDAALTVNGSAAVPVPVTAPSEVEVNGVAAERGRAVPAG